MIGGAPAGSSRAERLDPSSLPVRFSAAIDGGADEAAVVLDRDRALVRRPMRSGPALTFTVPVNTFSGVAVRMEPVGTNGDLRVILELRHPEPGLSLRILTASEPADVAADWEAWGKALNLPLLIVTPDGAVETAEDTGEGLRTGRPKPRRRYAFFKGRRSRFLRRRKPGFFREIERISGREIIARN
ncbi:MAG TPA: DUF6101 family protein [Bauldia sp.]|nr:DUF6101 family protein [Bauldia sp.]